MYNVYPKIHKHSKTYGMLCWTEHCIVLYKNDTDEQHLKQLDSIQGMQWFLKKN